MRILEGVITIQTFPDHDQATSYPQIKTGTLQQLWPWIKQENQKGMGIFYAVNSMKPNKRNAASVTRINAWFADIDGIHTENQKHEKIEQLLQLDLPPSCIVETKNGLHVLWYAQPNEPIEPEEYKCLNQNIIRKVGGDKSAKDIARVLRLPNTLHQKNPNQPHETLVVYEDRASLQTSTSMTKFFPTSWRPTRKPRQPRQVFADQHPEANGWPELVTTLSSYYPPKGQRHRTLMIALGNAIRLGIPKHQAINDLYPLLAQWRQGEQRNITQEINDAAEYAYNTMTPYTERALLRT